MADPKDAELAVDHQKARDYIDDYKEAVTNSFIAQVAILTGAIQDFNTFRDLPPSPDIWALVIETAFNTVADLVPMLKFDAFLAKELVKAEESLKKAQTRGLQYLSSVQKEGKSAQRI